MAYRIGWGPLNGRPMISSKINTLLQVLYLLAVMAHAAYGLPSQGWVDALSSAHVHHDGDQRCPYVQEFTHRALEVVRA